MESGQSVTGPINFGNPIEFTILQLAEMITKLTGSPSKIVSMPLPADDPKQRQPNISRARTQLGWEPRIHLEDGLKATISYFSQQA
jgi:UDP-glucuronate decarboxylase